MSSTRYQGGFYARRDSETRGAAEAILSAVGDLLPRIDSAVDVGCAVGTWLSVLQEKGVGRVCGIDGEWVHPELLEIPKEFFVAHDLSKSADPPVDERFDLAISMEVAEHLPPERARDFVTLLTNFADVVLFSAAVPFQGGVDHLNEQWPEYWIGLFEERDYVALDVIRKRVWSDETIPYWYRQNTLLYVKREKLPELRLPTSHEAHIPPEIYLLSYRTLRYTPRIKQAADGLYRALRRRALRTLHKRS